MPWWVWLLVVWFSVATAVGLVLGAALRAAEQGRTPVDRLREEDPPAEERRAG
ncbi:hypothetical protein [Geodermatophilus sp. SYSU D01119]